MDPVLHRVYDWVTGRERAVAFFTHSLFTSFHYFVSGEIRNLHYWNKGIAKPKRAGHSHLYPNHCFREKKPKNNNKTCCVCCVLVKGACSDQQPHPRFFSSIWRFGTRSLVIMCVKCHMWKLKIHKTSLWIIWIQNAVCIVIVEYDKNCAPLVLQNRKFCF